MYECPPPPPNSIHMSAFTFLWHYAYTVHFVNYCIGMTLCEFTPFMLLGMQLRSISDSCHLHFQILYHGIWCDVIWYVMSCDVICDMWHLMWCDMWCDTWHVMWYVIWYVIWYMTCDVICDMVWCDTWCDMWCDVIHDIWCDMWHVI